MNNEVCESCGVKISEGIYRYSMNSMGKGLCMSCQKVEREKTMPPKLAKFLNKTL